MKSEERHQLLTNDLGAVAEKTVGFFERHLGTGIVVVCLALLLPIAWFGWTSVTESGSSTGWTALVTAENEEELGTVVDKYKGKPPGQWAQLQIAEKALQTALPLMFSNREIAVSDLKHARERFEALLQEKTVPAMIRERALWGLALCLETSCDGDTAKPIEAFERLVSDFPDTMFKAVADDRIAALKKKDAAEFYAWFSKENPQPQEVRPKDGINLPGPSDPDGESDDFVPRMPITPKVPTTDTKTTQEPEESKAKPVGEKPESGNPADSVNGVKSSDSDPKKNVEKPNEKN